MIFIGFRGNFDPEIHDCITGTYTNGELVECEDWQDKPYCELHPDDKSECICLREKEIPGLIYCPNRKHCEVVIRCENARQKTDMEKFKDNNPDCLYYGYTNSSEPVCVEEVDNQTETKEENIRYCLMSEMYKCADLVDCQFEKYIPSNRTTGNITDQIWKCYVKVS